MRFDLLRHAHPHNKHCPIHLKEISDFKINGIEYRPISMILSTASHHTTMTEIEGQWYHYDDLKGGFALKRKLQEAPVYLINKVIFIKKNKNDSYMPEKYNIKVLLFK